MAQKSPELNIHIKDLGLYPMIYSTSGTYTIYGANDFGRIHTYLKAFFTVSDFFYFDYY